MCQFFNPDVPRKCTEDDAEEVIEKARLNFCEWYKPSATAFDPQRATTESRAHGELASLFGDGKAAEPEDDAALQDVEDLFK
jgi:hypothetical protein